MHSLLAAEPPGVHYGLGHQAHGRAVGRIGSSSLHHPFRGRFSQLSDHSQIRLLRHDHRDCRGFGMLHRHRGPHSPSVPQGRHRRPEADQAAGSARESHARVCRADAPVGDDQSAHPWVWFFHLVAGAAERASGQDHRRAPEHRPVGPIDASPWLFVPASQAHDERQTRRAGIREIQGGTDRLKKKPFARTQPRHWYSRTRSRYIATRR
jgi:hypothetical protein